MKKGICVFVMILTMFVANASAQLPSATANAASLVPAETKELVRRLLEANGMRASIILIFEDIIKNAPAESQQELRDLLKSDVIIDNIIPVYAKHFTADELKELIAFYKSPVGSKNLNLTPQLMTEVMQVTKKYFEDNVKKLENPAKAQAKP